MMSLRQRSRDPGLHGMGCRRGRRYGWRRSHLGRLCGSEHELLPAPLLPALRVVETLVSNSQLWLGVEVNSTPREGRYEQSREAGLLSRAQATVAGTKGNIRDPNEINRQVGAGNDSGYTKTLEVPNALLLALPAGH
jgi:hypothetical protein